MLLWIAFAVLTAIVVAAVTRPLLTGRADTNSAREADLAVYRDQLREIDADRDRGLISSEEAENARAELARRILKRAEEAGEAPESAVLVDRATTWSRAGLLISAAIPVAAIAVYLAIGRPELPDQPLHARMSQPTAEAQVAEMIGKVEKRLRENPEDGRGWDVIAPVYVRMQRFDAAVNAYEKALRLLGESEQRLAGLGEALIFQHNGVVVEPARQVFERLNKLDGNHPLARFWLAMAKEQDGDKEGARAAYASLLDESPADAGWRPLVEERLKGVGGTPKPAAVPKQQTSEAPASGAVARDGNTVPNSAAAPPGPTAQDIAAAENMSVEERAQFVSTMVERLAGKLRSDPSDFEGWKRLVRAYVVLGRKEDAARALAEARQSFAADEARLTALSALATELGLGT